MSTSSLRGQHTVVIGGSSGIGFAVAQAALAEGAAVAIGSSSSAKVAAAVERLGAGATGHPVDVRDEASVAAFYGRIGALDHLVYTAGDWGPLRAGGAIAQLDFAGANGTFAVRFWGAIAAIKHAQGKIASNGSATITNGAVAHRPRKGAAIASAMAGSIEHLTRALAVDLAPLRVNAVCPGIVLTEVWNDMPADRRDAQLKRMTDRQPLPRGGDPAEVAQAYLYLIKGGFTTGQVLIVDGGYTLI